MEMMETLGATIIVAWTQADDRTPCQQPMNV